ncbi:MAG: VWA-like domain-containing protein [Actinomycetota bacterium]|nr:VWA-like domain-containing protein [Actinomycetota bacterium]MDQ3679464.1 VWA-like domain-containing protein [Actinomycetota bacterium]
MSEPSLDAHKLAVARLWAVSRHPYLASALFAIQPVARTGLGGAAVDESWRLYVDPEVVDEWSVEVLGSLLVHHTGHLLRDHAGRAQRQGVARDTSKDWALAADAEINDDLMGTGLRLIDPVLPQALGWNPGRLAEEYFHCRHHETELEPDCGSGADGVRRPWELMRGEGGGLPPGERRLISCQVASEVLQHSREGRGRLPNSWVRWAEEVLEPKVDWRKALGAELRKGVGAVSGRVDYTYRRPSRRASVSGDVVLPALERPVPEVAVVCDTSGSMSEAQLGQVLVEVEGLLRSVGLARRRVRVLAADAAVHTVQRVASASQLRLVGGGGTDMGAGIEAAVRLRPRPSVVVVLTDGMTPWPAQPPKGVQVVVALIGTDQARGGRPWAAPEWARVVRIDDAA